MATLPIPSRKIKRDLRARTVSVSNTETNAFNGSSLDTDTFTATTVDSTTANVKLPVTETLTVINAVDGVMTDNDVPAAGNYIVTGVISDVAQGIMTFSPSKGDIVKIINNTSPVDVNADPYQISTDSGQTIYNPASISSPVSTSGNTIVLKRGASATIQYTGSVWVTLGGSFGLTTI